MELLFIAKGAKVDIGFPKLNGLVGQTKIRQGIFSQSGAEPTIEDKWQNELNFGQWILASKDNTLASQVRSGFTLLIHKRTPQTRFILKEQ